MKIKKLIFIASVGIAALPLFVLADAPYLTFSNPTFTGAGINGNGGTSEAAYIFDQAGNNISGNGITFSATGGNFTRTLSQLGASNLIGTYRLVMLDVTGIGAGTYADPACGAGQTLTNCQNNYGYSPDSSVGASVSFTLSAAPIVPSVASSDIAAVGGPMLGAFIYPGEWVLENFGPPLFVILLVFAVFFAIYHRVKVGRWL